MRIQRPSQLITANVILLSGLTIGCAHWSLHLRHHEEQAYETRREPLRRGEELAARATTCFPGLTNSPAVTASRK